MGQQYLVNGEPVALPDNVKTAGEVKGHLGIPPDRSVVATVPDGSRKQIPDTQIIPGEVTVLETPPRFRYGRLKGEALCNSVQHRCE